MTTRDCVIFLASIPSILFVHCTINQELTSELLVALSDPGLVVDSANLDFLALLFSSSSRFLFSPDTFGEGLAGVLYIGKIDRTPFCICIKNNALKSYLAAWPPFLLEEAFDLGDGLGRI